MPEPAVGERRTIGGQAAQWDGHGWLPAEPTPEPSQGYGSSLESIGSPAGLAELKQYGSELVGGGPARTQALEYGKKEGGAFLSALNPINQVRGMLRLVTTNPATTLSDLYGTGKAAIEGDPRAIGGVLGTIVAPKADAAVLRGVNSAASAVADSPNIQRGAGYIGGAGAGIAGGMHPFILARAGQMAAPAIGGAAKGIANVTGKVMDTLGMREANPIDVHAPNVSGYQPPAPDYMGSLPSEQMFQAEHGMPSGQMELPRGPAQGTYVQLPNGEWGVKALPGHSLEVGQPVNATSRAGLARMHTVQGLTPEGLGVLREGETADIPVPEAPSAVGETIGSMKGPRFDPALRDKILRILAEQGKP